MQLKGFQGKLFGPPTANESLPSIQLAYYAFVIVHSADPTCIDRKTLKSEAEVDLLCGCFLYYCFLLFTTCHRLGSGTCWGA